MIYAHIVPGTGVIRASGETVTKGDAITSCPDGCIAVFPVRKLDPRRDEWDPATNAPRPKAEQPPDVDEMRDRAIDELRRLIAAQPEADTARKRARKSITAAVTEAAVAQALADLRAALDDT